ncbi:hypothetical protein DS745_05610 [Anaerobacillus alkaliphilus]|uniref:Uncharacterized protein n=1 Tax=Anaerobacillus alkaliphilus TaxID=1548597 RepID=A0A4Q0VVB1_9BACI|nr:hypothetical protein [Anaerobacillus alkaliphilus]RXJ02786.1 hypothetical protein DS745_05610 [Anaerobacillus alkaliphilus]
MSRLSKYQYEKKQSYKRKLVIGLVSLSTTFVLTTGVAFANSDIDISTLLQNWYNKKANEAIQSMEVAVENELERQKQRLKEEVQLALERSAFEIASFTQQQIEMITNLIEEHADHLVANINYFNDTERQKIESQLTDIMNDAIQAMNQLISDSQPVEEEPGDKASIVEEDDAEPIGEDSSNEFGYKEDNRTKQN